MNDNNVPFVSSVFHPTDFSPSSQNAFAHALAVALVRQTELTLLNVGSDGAPSSQEWTQFPGVRETLERWGLLKKGSPRSAVFESLGMKVRKVKARGSNAASSILDYLDRNPVDLIVLSTEGREGLPRWIRPSLAERVARKSRSMTLFVPSGSRGLVSLEHGEIFLRRILIPVDHSPDPYRAMVYASRASVLAAGNPVEITLLHINNGAGIPALNSPSSANCSWQTLERQGDVVEEILRLIEEKNVDLIAMTTRGREGVLDALRGSVTEQVLRRAPRPLLAVPAS